MRKLRLILGLAVVFLVLPKRDRFYFLMVKPKIIW